MRTLVIGAGAIGTYLGGSLLAAGHKVTFLARPAAAKTLRASGIRIGPASLRPAVAASPAEALAQLPEVIIFALKSYDTANALAELRAVTAAPPPLLCVQNGVDNEAEMASVFGAERVISGTVTTAVSKSGPGQITVERERGIGLALGHPLSGKIEEALRGANFRVRVYHNAGAMKWSKLLTNLTGNAMSAILDMSVAELFANPQTFRLEMGMLREGLAVMRALKYQVVDLPKTPVRALAFAAENLPLPVSQLVLKRAVSAGRGGKVPSFHTDLHGGRGQTEVRWLNGAVAAYGAQLGVPTPVNRVLTETLESLSAGRLSKENFHRQPEALLRLINA